MSGIMKYCDFHADTLTELTDGDLYRNTGDVDLRRVKEQFKQYVQIFAIWKDQKYVRSTPEDFRQIYTKAVNYLQNTEESISFCRSTQDMEQAWQQGRAAAFLSIEDCSYMGEDIEQIWELGFRFAMLTWNYENQYGYGSVVNQKAGLKPAGKELVRKLTEKNIVIDLSHLSDAGAEDVFLLTDEPVIASHSNAREICDHPRNLCEAHIKEIIRRKGVIGINMYRPFVGKGEKVGLTELCRHMDYILEKGGEDALMLGCDFDGCDGLFPEGIKGVQSMSNLWDYMEKSGFPRAILEKIFFENGYRFLKNNLKN